MKTLSRLGIGSVVIILIWYLFSLISGPMLIPRPEETIKLFFSLILNGELLLHGAASLLRLISGILAALLFGIPIGIIAGTTRLGDRILAPVVYLLYPLPKIAFLPVFMLIFGLGNMSKIILLFSVILFQIILAARDGVKDIPEAYHRVARLHRLNRFERTFKLYLPSTLSGIFSALRISTGIGMSVLFFAENYASHWGLGYFIMNNWVMINYKGMFAGILMLGLTASALLFSIDTLESRVCRWK